MNYAELSLSPEFRAVERATLAYDLARAALRHAPKETRKAARVAVAATYADLAAAHVAHYGTDMGAPMHAKYLKL